MIKAAATRFCSPYNGAGKINIPYLKHDQKQSGVYLIKNDKGVIVYIGFSEGSLYKTITRHFQKWTDISREVKTRFTYDSKKGYTVRVIYTTPARASILEKYLISKIQPKDNEIKYKNYLTEAATLTAARLFDETEIYSGKEEDFPF